MDRRRALRRVVGGAGGLLAVLLLGCERAPSGVSPPGLMVPPGASQSSGPGAARVEAGPLTATPPFATDAVAEPTEVVTGQATRIVAGVRGEVTGPVLVDVEVRGPSGEKVFQQFFDNEVFAAGQRREYLVDWAVPIDAPTGAYRVVVAVFEPGWRAERCWNDQAARIAVTSAIAARQRPLLEPSPQALPAWQGFNLIDLYRYEGADRRFRERDFAWIAELGFNFVRIPLDYRFWVERNDWTKLRQAGLGAIDEAVRFGERYGVHVCLNFYRVPGHGGWPLETASLWSDEGTQRLAASYWERFAERYRGVPNRLLSFNLFNEPPDMDARLHRTVVERVLAAIRRQDEQRLVICDGRSGAPPSELVGLGVAAAARGYDPFRLSHYRAEWVAGAEEWDRPSYPLREGGRIWNKDALRQRMQRWRDLQRQGMGVLVGEFGAYHRTPHDVVLAWMRDNLELWKEAGWSWALWNFSDRFGVLDSERTDVAYTGWRGHRLDRAMLELLQTVRA